MSTELKNSQRINYKATYIQIAPKPIQNPGNRDGGAVKSPLSQLKRAIEKAAFIQSLKITPTEITALKRGLSRKASDAITKAILAVESLVNDNTSASTLNNAAGFADIDSADLITIANQLIEYRTAIADGIAGNLANILQSFKLAQSRQTVQNAAVSKPARAEKLPEGAQVQTGVNHAGVTTRTVYVSAPVEKKGDKTSLNSFNADITIDGATQSTSTVTSAAGTPSSIHQPTAEDAINWAEKNQPKLYAQLYDAASPYFLQSANESKAKGSTKSLIQFLNGDYQLNLNIRGTKGAVIGFESRMTIEPVGNLHLERIEMYPAGMERGELVHSVPLAPNETVNISHKEWAVSKQEFEDIVQDYFEGYSEEGVAEKNDIAMSNESQSRHATALSLGASLSASYSSVTLSTNANYNTNSSDDTSKKDSRNHSMDVTKKASARTKKDHKVTFKVTSVAGSEDQSVRVITNPSDTNAMRIDYFQLARKWKVDLLRYGLRMTYDIVIPNPGSALVTKVKQINDLDALLNVPFHFDLPLTAITYNPFASQASLISNYAELAAQYNASVTAPPEAQKWVDAHKEYAETGDQDYDSVYYDSVSFETDENYYIESISSSWNYEHHQGDNGSVFKGLKNNQTIHDELTTFIGMSGQFALDIVYQKISAYAINFVVSCRPKPQVYLDWRIQVWNQLRQAAEEQYNKGLQNLRDQRAQLVSEIAGYDALTLRRMEQEEIMKGVLRWIFGPSFQLVPFNISSLFGSDTNDPGVQDVLDPNRLNNAEWLDVMEHGEFIKYIHNAIEWENVLYFTYPYFWDDNKLWDFKKFLFHPDPTHRMFLRAGAARVVLPIRPGFENSFTQLIETGAFNSLPGNHPYVTIAQEIQNFANTNYPGFPPANPAENVRPLLYLEQRRVWREMQYLIQLLNAYAADPANGGLYPTTAQGLAVLQPYIAATNAANAASNAQQLALDPTLTTADLLPDSYANVPLNDYWGTPYFYKMPGDTGDYDLISYGSDGVADGVDKAADISSNAEASLIATWYEYTPTSAMDIAITMNAPNTVPPNVIPGIS